MILSSNQHRKLMSVFKSKLNQKCWQELQRFLFQLFHFKLRCITSSKNTDWIIKRHRKWSGAVEHDFIYWCVSDHKREDNRDTHIIWTVWVRCTAYRFITHTKMLRRWNVKYVLVLLFSTGNSFFRVKYTRRIIINKSHGICLYCCIQ